MNEIELAKIKFLKVVQDLFEIESQKSISLETDLHQLSEWSSLQAMLLVSEIDTHYNVVLSTTDIIQSNTVEKLFIRVHNCLKNV